MVWFPASNKILPMSSSRFLPLRLHLPVTCAPVPVAKEKYEKRLARKQQRRNKNISWASYLFRPTDVPLTFVDVRKESESVYER